MCACITIIEVLSSLTTIFIGLAVVYIAWQQHLINKTRLRMELYDRRYKIYYAVLKVITKHFDEFNKHTARDLHREVSATRFFFRYKTSFLSKSKENEDLKYDYPVKKDLETEGLADGVLEKYFDNEVLEGKYFDKKVLEKYLDKEVLLFVKRILLITEAIVDFREKHKASDREYIKFDGLNDLEVSRQEADNLWTSIGKFRQEAIRIFSKYLNAKPMKVVKNERA